MRKRDDPTRPTQVTVSLHDHNFTWAAGYGHLPETFDIEDVYAALGEALGHFAKFIREEPWTGPIPAEWTKGPTS